jgi:hypothetical protein
MNRPHQLLKATVVFTSLLLSLILPETSLSQTTIGLEIRPRAELRHGFKDLISDSEHAAFFIEQRSRLNLFFQSEKISTSLKIQDVRIWGETAQINKSDNLISVHEAWAQYAFTKTFSLRAGRQELVYDDHRIMGNLDWAAQGRSHDAFKFIYFDSTWNIHAVVAYNQNSNIPEPAKLTDNFYTAPGGFPVVGGGQPNYKHMQMLWADRTLGRFYTSFLFLSTGWQMPDTTVNNLVTTGVNPVVTISGKVKILGSYYYQFGYDRSDASVDSYLLSLSLNLTGAKSSHFIGFDRLSGTGVASSKSNTFDPLFGTHHKFYGLMDYFYVGNPHAQQGKTVGLQDFFIRSKFNLNSTKTSVSTELHHFVTPVRITEPSGSAKSLSSTLGSEVDIVLQHSFQKDFVVHLGYSQMFATESLQAIKGGDREGINNWAWLMLTFKPELFNSSSLLK